MFIYLFMYCNLLKKKNLNRWIKLLLKVNKSLRLTANAIQNYSFDRTDKMRIDMMPDEKDSGISQVLQFKIFDSYILRIEFCISNFNSANI